MTDSRALPLDAKVGATLPADLPSIPHRNANAPSEPGTLANVPHVDGKNRKANTETEDDGKDYGEWWLWRPETAANNPGGEDGWSVYNPDTDSDEETRLQQNHRKTPRQTHAPRSGHDTEDSWVDEAKEKVSPAQKLP